MGLGQVYIYALLSFKKFPTYRTRRIPLAHDRILITILESCENMNVNRQDKELKIYLNSISLSL